MKMRQLMLALACAACQVGDPLVDDSDSGEGSLRIMCNYPPECRPYAAIEGPAHPPRPVALPIECAGTCLRDTGSGAEVCPPGLLEELPSSAHCMAAELQPSAAESLSVEQVDWQDVNLTLRAERPLALVLRGGTLQRVYFRLDGPITLHMEAMAQLVDLRILGRRTDQGAPQVEIDAQNGAGLSINRGDERFPGEIVLRAGVFTDIDAHADALTLESVLVQDASLYADTTTLTDVTLEHAEVDTQHALWSAFVATEAALSFCGDARLISGQMSRCITSTCEGSSVRLFNSSYLSGTLDGAYGLSGANFENVQLGVTSATQIFAYGSSISSTQMCENMQQLALGDGSQIKCSGCVEPLLETLQVCALEERTGKWLKNFCTKWRADDVLPACAADIPTRANRAR